MKKSIFIALGILFLGVILCNAQNVNIDLTVNYNGNIKSDSVYLFFYTTTNSETGQALPAPDKKFVFHKANNEFQIYPGAYTMVAMNFGYKYLYTRIYIPPTNDFSMEITFNPMIIGWGGITEIEQIKEVTLRGDFNGYEKNGEIALTKNGKVWKLDEKPEVLKEAKEYTFYVNGQETTDLLNPSVNLLASWYVFKNRYTDNELVFDPSLYSLVNKESMLKVDDTLQQYQFKQLVNEMNIFEKEQSEIFKKASSAEAALPLFDTLLWKYSIIKNKYPNDFSQPIIEKQLVLNSIKSLYLEAPQGNSSDTEIKEKKKEYFLGDEFGLSFIKINDLINELNPNSFLLKGDFAQSFKMLQDLLNEYPEIATKNNLSEKYYDKFLEGFIEESTNKKLCSSILFYQAFIYKRSDEEKAMAIFNELKNNPDYADFINNETIDRILNEFNIKLGKIAPDFSVELLDGKNISLNDYKGKFVFIDFWGSWCAPCRNEIPHIKLLYDSISRDKLEIIGLAQDDETKLRSYIQEQKIEYPNALASKELLSKYGISKYPTSFLINPKGKIVRIDVRGADAMKFIGEEIEDYFD